MLNCKRFIEQLRVTYLIPNDPSHAVNMLVYVSYKSSDPDYKFVAMNLKAEVISYFTIQCYGWIYHWVYPLLSLKAEFITEFAIQC